MKKTVDIIYFSLIGLTILMALASSFVTLKLAVILIVAFSWVKFNMVAFEFMELKKAHGFWKFLIVFYSAVISVIYSLLLS